MTSVQKPLGAGFGAASTADEVLRGISLAGKTAIVTGGYSGIGLPTVEALVAAGASVIVPARDIGKANKALSHVPGALIEPMDLLDPASIDAFAQRVVLRHPIVHILINSAGIMANPLTRDSRGYESQFSTNHLGHFQLTCRLWSALVRANGARVVAVSSQGHHFSNVDLDDPNYERREYERWAAYGQSKTANVLFAVELDRRGAGQGIRGFAVHPGRILTDIARFMSVDEILASGISDADGNPIVDPKQGMKNPQQGAATSVWCATSPQLDGMGGLYCEDCDVAEPRTGHPMVAGVNPWATDPDTARKLWTLSERLCGVTPGEVREVPVSDDDYLQLSRVLTEMVWRLDNGRAKTAYELFTTDGVLDVAEAPMVGQEALSEWGKALDENPLGIHHVVSNARFTSDGDGRARGTSTLTAYMGTTVPVAVGVDHDVFVRTAEGWRFSSRRWNPLFTR